MSYNRKTSTMPSEAGEVVCTIALFPFVVRRVLLLSLCRSSVCKQQQKNYIHIHHFLFLIISSCRLLCATSFCRRGGEVK